MGLPLHAVLTDPEETGEHDIEISHTDHFLLVRGDSFDPGFAPEELAAQPPELQR